MKKVEGSVGNIEELNDLYDIVEHTFDKTCKMRYTANLQYTTHENYSPMKESKLPIEKVSIIKVLLKNLHGNEYLEDSDYYKFISFEYCMVQGPEAEILYYDLNCFYGIIHNEKITYYEVIPSPERYISWSTYIMKIMQKETKKKTENKWFQYNPGEELEELEVDYDS